MPENTEIETALFDLDGTLVNNYKGIYSCLNETFDKFSIQRQPYERVVSCVGGSILLTIKKLLGDVPNLNEIGEYYAEHFNAHVLVGLRALPYTKELLAALKERGLKIGLLTNKAEDASKLILEHLGMSRYFDTVCGTTLHSVRKPDAEFTMRALNVLNATPANSVMIGDSQYDCLAGKNANMRVALVATGGDSRESLKAKCPDWPIGIFRDMKDLGKAVWNIEMP